MPDKLILTNLTRLQRKYGVDLPRIRQAITRWIAADKARGLTSIVISLEDSTTMKKHGAAPVTSSTSTRQHKAAVDDLYRRLAPDYITLLGAPDVIPHQRLKNPAFDPGQPDNDPDEWVPSDLPYACNAGYGTDPSKFVAPSRVVGRVPDLTGAPGAKGADYLIDVIDSAAGAKTISSTQYRSFLAMSAKVWQVSSVESIKAVFGTGEGLQLSPPKGPSWTSTQLARRSHFINCHGAQLDPHFYGQQGAVYPIAHDGTYLIAKNLKGTVVAAECCYGAELYDPSALPAKQMGIANTYLARGGYGFFGSTTIAYGPAAGNDYADLICQYFLQQMLAGASLGRAALVARQTYVKNASPLDPVDLKTLAQYLLLGDPSLQPATAPKSLTPAIATPDTKSMFATAATARAGRRMALAETGQQLEATLRATAKTAAPRGAALVKQLKVIARKLKLPRARVLSFRLAGGPRGLAGYPKALVARAPEVRVHLLIAHKTKPVKGIQNISVASVREAQGKVLSVRQAVSR
jgi:hypothetical protein